MARKHTPIHLQPHAPVHERVLAPGDPGRALRLAQDLIDGPKMLNHARGLWGYSGPARSDGSPLTVQSTGLGGPSAAAVVADLAHLGARRIVRVGTCGAAPGSGLELGSLIVPATVLGPGGGEAATDPGLAANLRASLPGAGTPVLASVDFAHEPAPPLARARDMTSAGLLEAAGRAGLAAAVVSVVALAGGAAAADEVLHAAELEAGRAALSALAG